MIKVTCKVYQLNILVYEPISELINLHFQVTTHSKKQLWLEITTVKLIEIHNSKLLLLSILNQ